MAWIAPPTFVNGAVLSAAQLNILSGDLEYLKGLASTVNVPFIQISGENDIEAARPYIRHRARYLHIYLSFDLHITSVSGTLETQYNSLSVSIYNTFAAGGVNPFAAYINIDLDAAPGPFTVGTWYPIVFVSTTSGGGYDYIYIQRVFESDEATA